MAEIERDEAGVYTGPGEKTIPLRTPVKRAGTDPLTSITVQEPTAKQLSAYLEKRNDSRDDGVAAMVILISLTSGQPPVDVEAMKQRDFDACAAFLEVFTTVPPKKSDS